MFVVVVVGGGTCYAFWVFMFLCGVSVVVSVFSKATVCVALLMWFCCVFVSCLFLHIYALCCVCIFVFLYCVMCFVALLYLVCVFVVLVVLFLEMFVVVCLKTVCVCVCVCVSVVVVFVVFLSTLLHL